MTSVLESMVVDEKQLPEKPVDREKVCIRDKNNNKLSGDIYCHFIYKYFILLVITMHKHDNIYLYFRHVLFYYEYSAIMDVIII